MVFSLKRVDIFGVLWHHVTMNEVEILSEAFKEVVLALADRGLALCSSEAEKQKFLASCEKDANKFLSEGFRQLSKNS